MPSCKFMTTEKLYSDKNDALTIELPYKSDKLQSLKVDTQYNVKVVQQISLLFLNPS